jgi:hypothetical protein
MDNFDKNVFVNCPFDSEYIPLLRPLLFTILYLGFEPRIALESSDSGFPRLEKLLNLIAESKYSIHDLSRMQSTNSREVYRMNMPFELGIDFGCRRYSSSKHIDKKFLILEKESHRYMKAISDINGLDIKTHRNDPPEIVRAIRDWFIETVKIKNVKSSTIIWYDYIDFQTKLYDKSAEGFSKSDIDLMTITELLDNMRIWHNAGKSAI